MSATYQKTVVINSIMVFHQLVNEYVNFACLVVKPNDKNRAVAIFLDRLNNASAIEEETADSVKKSVKKTLDVMKDIEAARGGDMEGYTKRHKILSEIPSILHIGAAYPQSALSRLAKLAGKL